MATEENREKAVDLVAIFLINFPAVNPTKANSANPRNVIGHSITTIQQFIGITKSLKSITLLLHNG